MLTTKVLTTKDTENYTNQMKNGYAKNGLSLPLFLYLLACTFMYRY